MNEMEQQHGVRKPSAKKKSGFAAWQLRAGRAAADISIQRLADLSGVSVSSIRRAEENGSEPMSQVNQKVLLDALAALGVSLSEPGAAPATVTMTDEAAARQTAALKAKPAKVSPSTKSSPASKPAVKS